MDSDVPLVGPDQRVYLSRMIDKAVEDHLTDELLGQLVRQSLNVNYYGADKRFLLGLIDDEVRKYARKIIASYLEEHDDDLFQGVMEQLQDIYLKPMTRHITDKFIAEQAR